MLIGVSFIIIGAVMLFNILFPEIQINFHVVWPSLLIVFSIYNMLKNKIFDVVSIVMFYIGFFFLTKYFLGDTIDISNLFWPILLLLIGIIIVIDDLFNKKDRIKHLTKDDGEVIYYRGIFNEIKDKLDREVKNINIETVFGEVDLDFRTAKFKNKETYINIIVIFGNSNLIFPEDVEVEFRNPFALFGSNENKKTTKNGTKKVIVYAKSIFGGVEIK
jgi:predicted membrane protein